LPYHVSKTDECPASKPYGVIKDADGEVMGCHETEDAAKEQMARLYSSEKADMEAAVKAAEPRHKFCPILDAKALDDGEVSAMFSVFGTVDLVGDRILPGAFTKTLKRWQDSKDPIPVIVSHQWDDVWAHIGFAEPKDVKQMPRGVVAKAKLDVDDNPLAAQAHKLMKRGTFKGWSFGYTVPEDGEKLVEEKGAMVNEITDLDLIEIGPTLKGANPEAQLQAAKAWLDREEEAGQLGTGKFSVHFAHALEKPEKTFIPPIADPVVPAEDPERGKAKANDPLRQREQSERLDLLAQGLPRNPVEPEPGPERVPPSEKALRKRHRELMLDMFTE
jgi:HK97 family phage prohead protease